MLNSVVADHLQEIGEFYTEAFRKFQPARNAPAVNVEFYPYVGINHTIRIRNGRAFVRISRICCDMPATAHRALAYILIAKLTGRKAPVEATKVYAEFIRSAEIRDRATENKRNKGSKVITSYAGEVYDLDEIFDSLNFWYFQGRLPKPVLTWSARKTYRILGHHDSTHSTVAISKSLDDAHVPPYVVEYVLYHEMLHIAHPTRHVNGRRYNHTAEFRRDERRFPDYERAEHWIEQSVRKLKRNARKR